MRRMAARLRDDFQTSLDLPSFPAVTREGFQRDIFHVRPNMANRFDNIFQTWFG